MCSIQQCNEREGDGFTGHKENLDLGLTYMNARYYVGGVGRFLSADTIIPDPKNPQQFNRYSYSLMLVWVSTVKKLSKRVYGWMPIECFRWIILGATSLPYCLTLTLILYNEQKTNLAQDEQSQQQQ